jgi:hypothetical protein
MKKSKGEVENKEKFYKLPIGSLGETAYLDIGNYVNNARHFPNILDGCKVSYKRLVWSALQFPKGKEIPTVNLISKVSETHPHSLGGIEGINAVFVNSGIFEGEGSFGYTDIDGTVNPPAAPRYLHNMLSEKYWDIIGDLIKYVPKHESPVGAMEPEFIPLPQPLCLSLHTSVVGLGFGLACNFPNFSHESLYKAMIKDNPRYLKPGIDLELVYEDSELEKLWNTGKGIVTYQYHMEVGKSPDDKTEGVYLSGDTCLFTPKLKKLRKLIEDGKVYTEDLTTFEGPRMFIGRIPGSRGFTLEDLVKIVDEIRKDSTVYNLNVTNGSTAFMIPLKEWLRCVYKNYLDLLEFARSEKLKVAEFDFLVYTYLPKIADYILNIDSGAKNELISKILDIPIEVVQAVMAKPISYLRKNKETSDRVKEVKARIKELKEFNAPKFTEDLIKKL